MLQFQSTFPVRGTTADHGLIRCAYYPFQSTFPVRGTTFLDSRNSVDYRLISIHVPREGNDGMVNIGFAMPRCISIHVPREGNDFIQLCSFLPHFIFQSTFPVRGTTSWDSFEGQVFCISIHVPREGNDGASPEIVPLITCISIHVPREGNDCYDTGKGIWNREFQSTFPVRGTTPL